MAGSTWNRRDFMRLGVQAAGTLTLGHTASASAQNGSLPPDAIKRVSVGSPITVPDNFGDTWVAAWADDDNLYAPCNDALGFEIPKFITSEHIKHYQSDYNGFVSSLTEEQKKQFKVRVIAMTRVEGNDPNDLRGVNVNFMDEYMESYDCTSAARQFDEPHELRLWKSSGCTFVDGALYWAISRHRYPRRFDIKSLRQHAANTSLIKSTDYGKTWTRNHTDNACAPMFPGSHFATPYFVDYGKTRPNVDNADRYIYAISNNGYWDNGDSMILGRVARSRIGRLNGNDWEFFTGGDGAKSANWTRNVTRATPILERCGQLGETGATYLAARGRYLMVAWHYPVGSGYFKGSSPSTEWNFYEAAHPWGPWHHIGWHAWAPQGYYCPVVCPKFQSENRVYVVTAGDFRNWWDHYHLTLVPVDLS